MFRFFQNSQSLPKTGPQSGGAQTPASAECLLDVQPEQTALRVAEGQSLLEACLKHQIPIEHACGGNARCSTCRVMVVEGAEFCSARTEAEDTLADRFGFGSQVRLACQTRLQGSAAIRRLVLDDRDRMLVANSSGSGGIKAVGEEITAAILFCDIRGFTRFANRVMAYDSIHFLNRFYETLGPVIVAQGGEINNTMGDGFLAIFHQPTEEASAGAAIEAGKNLLKAMSALQDYTKSAYGEVLRIGVGIHSGTVIRGIVGHGPAKRASVIGDNVNFASRVENATKAAGQSLLVSDRVHSLIGARYEWHPSLQVALPGIAGEALLHAPKLEG